MERLIGSYKHKHVELVMSFDKIAKKIMKDIFLIIAAAVV
jgi:hypothetical protein